MEDLLTKGDAMGKIRNPKLEIRNNIKIQINKTRSLMNSDILNSTGHYLFRGKVFTV